MRAATDHLFTDWLRLKVTKRTEAMFAVGELQWDLSSVPKS